MGCHREETTQEDVCIRERPPGPFCLEDIFPFTSTWGGFEKPHPLHQRRAEQALSLKDSLEFMPKGRDSKPQKGQAFKDP